MKEIEVVKTIAEVSLESSKNGNTKKKNGSSSKTGTRDDCDDQASEGATEGATDACR